MTEPRRPIVELPVRVRYHECDGQGIVFNAHYPAYVDMRAFEAENALFGSHGEFLAHRTDVVVAEANLKFRAPARYDEELVHGFEIRRGGTPVSEATLRYVCVDPATLRPAAPPDAVRKAYAAHLAED